MDSEDDSGSTRGFCDYVLTGLSILMFICTLPLSLFFTLKIVQEYERAVIFRLGRLLPGGAKGPGLFFILPCIDSYQKVDLRTVSFDVPPQEIVKLEDNSSTLNPCEWTELLEAIYKHFKSRCGPGDEVVWGFNPILTLTNEVDLLNEDIEDLKHEIFTQQQIKSSRRCL